ncbi:MAG: hypothetical protein P1U87_20665 [Verrucomicrobiales bacterium]|nr:hypothetical protein [Verrucomicrobiales bacterium]
MKTFLPILTLAVFSALHLLPSSASAGGTGYRSCGNNNCATSKFQTPRLYQLLPYRHYGDHRRYNAAACCGEVQNQAPYVIKTVVVSKKRVPHVTYDSNGRRYCRKVLQTTYKDIYSNGRCRVWTTVG